MSSTTTLSNQSARHVALFCSGLHEAPVGACDKATLLEIIKNLGYVQQDPLQVVARAHDHILWTRNNNYRPKMLDSLLEKDRQIFEHFSHDACLLPMDTLPYWQNQFKRNTNRFDSGSSRAHLLTEKNTQALVAKITHKGPLCSTDFKIDSNAKQRATWTKPEHKQILDKLWLTGDLAVSKREKFRKYYDLASRIYPKKLINAKIEPDDQIAWFAVNALKRLGFATIGDIKRFWDACDIADVNQWHMNNKAAVVQVAIESKNGELTNALMLRSQKRALLNPPVPTKRIRIISPFDPIARDRNRLKRLFGFDYKIEIYVPASERRYGYYVYPLLEFDAFVGRIEIRHDKAANTINIDNLWNEPGFRFGKQRMKKLASEVDRVRRFCGAESVVWSA